MIINKPIDTFIVGEVNDITWDQANQNWDTFYADEYYAKYLKAEFGITIPSPPNAILWDHAVILTIGFPGRDETRSTFAWTEEKKKKIKLIFIIDDLEKVFEKGKNNTVRVQFKDQVENILTEKLNQKVVLENVQIIHG